MRFFSTIKFFALVSYLGPKELLAITPDETDPSQESNSAQSSYRRENTKYDKILDTPTVFRSEIVITDVGSDCASQLSDEGLLDQLGVISPCKGQSFDCSKNELESWITCICMQMCKGIQVYDSEVTFTYNSAGQIRLSTSTYKNDVKFEKTVPKSSASDIQKIIVNKDVNGKQFYLRHYSSKPVILSTGKAKNQQSQLAWEVRVSKKGEVKESEVVIDDETGKELIRKDKTLDKRGGQGRSVKSVKKENPTIFHNSEKSERRIQESLTDTLLGFVTALLLRLTAVLDLLTDTLTQGTPTSSPISSSPSIVPSSSPTSASSSASPSAYSVVIDECGDGILGDSEECDGQLMEATCADATTGCLSGTPKCTPKCQLDFSTCTVGSTQSEFQLDLTFDTYPRETSWRVISKNSSSTVLSGGQDGTYVGLGSDSISEIGCLETLECYEFQIFDSAGDGICCEYGTGDFIVYLDDLEILTNLAPDFDERTRGFIGNCTGNDYYDDTFYYFDENMNNPANLNCEDFESPFRMDLILDKFPHETSWTLAASNGTVLLAGGPYEVTGFYREERCLASDDCYVWTIEDLPGDGICCEFVDGEFSIFYNNELLPDGEDTFLTIMRYEFGNCDNDTT